MVLRGFLSIFLLTGNWTGHEKSPRCFPTTLPRMTLGLLPYEIWLPPAIMKILTFSVLRLYASVIPLYILIFGWEIHCRPGIDHLWSPRPYIFTARWWQVVRPSVRPSVTLRYDHIGILIKLFHAWLAYGIRSVWTPTIWIYSKRNTPNFNRNKSGV